MLADRIEAAIVRIEKALDRIEQAAMTDPKSNDKATQERHDKLRTTVAETVSELDQLLFRLEA